MNIINLVIKKLYKKGAESESRSVLFFTTDFALFKYLDVLS